jgi:hypothetical protein
MRTFRAIGAVALVWAAGAVLWRQRRRGRHARDLVLVVRGAAAAPAPTFAAQAALPAPASRPSVEAAPAAATATATVDDVGTPWPPVVSPGSGGWGSALPVGTRPQAGLDKVPACDPLDGGGPDAVPDGDGPADMLTPALAAGQLDYLLTVLAQADVSRPPVTLHLRWRENAAPS